MDPVETTAIVTALIGGGTAVVGAVIAATARYIFRLPAQQNGALRELVGAITDLKAYNRREHQAFLKAIEDLADVLAPRRPVGGGPG